MTYDEWKQQTPPQFNEDAEDEILICDFCDKECEELNVIKTPFRNIIKKEYICLECKQYANENNIELI